MVTDLDADRTEPDLEDGQGSAGSEAIRLERNAKVELAREGGHRVPPSGRGHFPLNLALSDIVPNITHCENAA